MNNLAKIIHPSARTLLIDKMVVGYNYLHQYDELAIRLKRMDVRPLGPDNVPEARLFLPEELHTWARTLLEQMGNQDDRRAACYFCGAQAYDGKLCDCFRTVVMKDWANVADPDLIRQLPANAIVTTCQCDVCGVPVPITARTVVKFYSKNKQTYRGRRLCHTHWLEQKRAQDQRQKAARAKRQQPKVESAKVVGHLDLSAINLPTQPVGEA